MLCLVKAEGLVPAITLGLHIGAGAKAPVLKPKAHGPTGHIA